MKSRLWVGNRRKAPKIDRKKLFSIIFPFVHKAAQSCLQFKTCLATNQFFAFINRPGNNDSPGYLNGFQHHKLCYLSDGKDTI